MADITAAVFAAETLLATCGGELHTRFNVTPSSLRAIKYVKIETIGKACKDPNVMAVGVLGKPLVGLCYPQWERVREKDAPIILIHEYLHTRGVSEYPHDRRAEFDSAHLTDEIRRICGK